MNVRSAVNGFAALVCIAAVSSAAPPRAHAQGYPTDLPLNATIRGMQQLNNSGQVGLVGLRARGDATLVVVRLEGEPSGRAEPAHIHRGRSCDTIDPKPMYPLNAVVNNRSTTLVHAPISRLLSGNYVVNVHSSSDPSHYVSCGHLYSS